MFIKRMSTTGALLLCGAMLTCGGLAATAFGDNPCSHKGDGAAKSKKPCNICDILFPKKDKSCGKAVEQSACRDASHKQPCNLCDRLFPKKDKPCAKTVAQAPACPSDGNMTADLPPNAEAGECYAKVIVPAEYRTVTERHMVQEASEQIEVVPAEFKWVEERVTIKEASTQLEVVPAEYRWQEKTIEVKPAHTGWVVQKVADCVLPPDKNKIAIGGEIFCLRTTPPVYKTIRTQCLVKPASVRTIAIPGEYQTVRRQVVASAATTRKVCIDAQYENIDKTVLVCPERVKWEHVVCEDKPMSDTVMNKAKIDLVSLK